MGGVGGSHIPLQTAPPSAREETQGRGGPPGAAAPASAPERPRSPARMIKLITWDAPAGRGAASTSGLGRGGGSCAAPGRPRQS